MRVTAAAAKGSDASPRRLAGVAPAPEPGRSPCEETISSLESLPAMDGAPELEAHRAEIFLRAKADPVMFLQVPARHELTPEGLALGRGLAQAERPAAALYEIYGKLAKRPELARAVLLRDGYLYAESPALSVALTELVRPEDLFGTPEVWLARGDVILRLERRDVAGHGTYFYAEGEQAGERARILLFDRVAASREGLDSPVHRDVSVVARELGFSELRVTRITARGIVAQARYGDDWVSTVLRAGDAALAFECEVVPAGRESAVRSARAEAQRALRVLDELRRVIRQQVREALPFDEPRTEVGQEDGKLRQHWRWAYQFGRSEFDYNEDRYRVFDGLGRPRVPQVCIDFVTDTFERASGSWYRQRGEPRERVQGRLDFTALGIDNERSVERFVEFAKVHPAWFEVEELGPEERIPYFRRKAFFAHLEEQKRRYQPGDIVTIYGLRDDEKPHYHSFIVYDRDPVSGVPSLVAANAGRPRIRPWESEMTSAPRRSIRARVHPRLEWLESVVAPGAAVSPTGASPTTTEL